MSRMIEPTKAMRARQLDAVLAAHARLLQAAQRDKGAPGIVFAAGMATTMLLAGIGRWIG